ncbi:MAG: glycosyltransferase family 1 protein [bacterium]|nr:glycosyltransferase family 1 protein [bacterium]
MKPLRIALDLRSAALKRGGIGRYTLSLSKAILRQARDYRDLFSFVLYTASHTDSLNEFDVQNLSVDHSLRWCSNGLLRNGLALPITSLSNRYDVLHSFDYLAPYSFFNRSSIISIHDLIPIHYPELASPVHRIITRCLIPRAVKLATAVIVQSQYVKQDLMSCLGTRADKIHVIPPGVEEHFSHRSSEEIKKIQRIYGLSNRYLLFLKGEDPKKNLKLTIKALREVFEREVYQDLKLVITGRADEKYRQEVMSIAGRFAQRIIWVGFVEEEHLPAIYGGAQAMLFPSICEGFGLPILEAMACGCPVITSNLTSMPEVAGDAAICLDPNDPVAIQHAIDQVLTNNEFRENIRLIGLERSTYFTWDRSAAKILDIYRSLADD